MKNIAVKNRTQGVTLLEILVSLAIFSIVILGATSFCFRNLQITRTALQQSQHLLHTDTLASTQNA
jgi:prepilin-type N-terminal cleavage/methylation domain-containing protein